MIAVGLDISTTTGFAAWDTDRHESSISVSTLRVDKETQWERGARLQGMVRAEIKKLPRVDVAVIELPQQMAGKNASTAILLNILASHAYRALRGCGLQQDDIEWVKDSTWRLSLYGFGLKKGWKSPDWKRHAKATCEQMGIKVSNQDEAEAAMLAFYAGRVAQRGKMVRRMEAAE